MKIAWGSTSKTERPVIPLQGSKWMEKTIHWLAIGLILHQLKIKVHNYSQLVFVRRHVGDRTKMWLRAIRLDTMIGKEPRQQLLYAQTLPFQRWSLSEESGVLFTQFLRTADLCLCPIPLKGVSQYYRHNLVLFQTFV